ncbi:MAG: pyridoxamine 5'-phosphate oxidase family protein [Desulfobulbaceae bacterium]|nr:pyridoxamine 5'-phosphate oxidase family protein [Desulfobulbaceae bacterium]
MIAEMKHLVREKTICVLATIAENKPYCSLMAYAANTDGTEIYMATLGSTRKFGNLSRNPAVSLMIDTREDGSRSQARALTVEGTCAPIKDAGKQQLVRTQLLATHPHLKDFLAHSDIELLCVTIKSFLLLKGLTEAHYAALD